MSGHTSSPSCTRITRLAGDSPASRAPKIPPPPPPPADEDLNGDGVVGLMDVLIVLSNWGAGDEGDVNGDGAVEFNDLVAILAAWG